MKGRFFAFEGIDGSGKSTQLALLAERLRSAGYEVLVTEEPSKGPIGCFTRESLKTDYPISEASSALLFAADRLDHLQKTGGILEQLERDVIILCDRYILSSLTYNSLANPLEWILAINEPALDALQVTAHLLFDLPAQLAMDRIHARPETKERYENLHQLHRVRMLYQQLAQSLPGQRILTFDAELDEQSLSDLVWETMQAYLPPLPS